VTIFLFACDKRENKCLKIFWRVNNFPECFSLFLTPLTKVVSEAQKYCTNKKKVTISSALLVAKENCLLYYNDCYIRDLQNLIKHFYKLYNAL